MTHWVTKGFLGLGCAVLLLILPACSRTPKWTAFVYPDASEIPNADQVQNYTIGNYETFEQCQEAAIERVRFLDAQAAEIFAYSESEEISVPEADYECGFRCTVREEYGNLLVCKTDRK